MNFLLSAARRAVVVLPAISLMLTLSLAPRIAAAATPVLQYVQTQQMPNGHARILLQFNGPTSMRATTVGPTSNYVLQFLGAIAAPTVPNAIPVNSGAIQQVSVAQLGNALTISIVMSSALQPKVSNSQGGLVIVDIPPGTASGAQGYDTQAPASSYSNGANITKIIRLHYADVSEVVGILTGNGSVAPGTTFNPQPGQIGAQPQPGFGTFNSGFNQGNLGQGVQPFQQYGQYQQPGFGQSYGDQQALGQRVSDTIAVDRRLNAIILTGTADQIAQSESLIARLDIPVASVLLDTKVIEVTESGAKSLGLNYNQSEAQPIAHIFNTQAQIVNNLPSQAIAGALAIQTDIFLLVSQGHARVLAAPKILTQDGVPASILTGDSLPIRITTPVGVGGVGAVSSQVEYINVGVNLQILPRITGAGGVDASVYSQVSSVTGFDSANDPQISTRQAQTKVNLMEGQTLVIGGLLQQRDIRNLQKIPILGDLPLVGALFRFYTETRQNTNLVITVTPQIVPAPSTGPPAPGKPAPRY